MLIRSGIPATLVGAKSPSKASFFFLLLIGRSDSLKEIAQYLGFQWSENDASGLHTLMWRSQWECSKDAGLKQKLVTYNAEDCEALDIVASTVAQLCHRQTEAVTSRDNSIVHTDSMKRESPYRFGKTEFSNNSPPSSYSHHDIPRRPVASV